MKLFIFSMLISVTAPALAMPMIEAVDEDLIYLNNGQVIFKDSPQGNSFQSEKLISSVSPKSNYTPTILADQAEAYKLYGMMRSDYLEEAQCTNMAHVWAYEEYKRSGLKSQKIFLFFTKKYIMRYRFGWWFHVSPLVQAKEGKEILQIVMDRRYTSLPLDKKTWTDHFVKTNRQCKEIDKISTFWNNQQSEDCYLMQVSMYYWQPRDIRLRDENGKDKTKFLKGEIRQAYDQAFNKH
jgi:hypothetical protein